MVSALKNSDALGSQYEHRLKTTVFYSEINESRLPKAMFIGKAI